MADCLDGHGCKPVIEISKEVKGLTVEFTSFLTASRDSMQAHARESREFWEDQTSHVKDLSMQIKECLSDAQEAALKFTEGHYRMSSIKDDVDSLAGMHRDLLVKCELEKTNHELAENGAHKTDRRAIKSEISVMWKVILIGGGAIASVAGCAIAITLSFHGGEAWSVLKAWMRWPG